MIESSYAQPVSLTASTEGKAYGLFALAMAITVVGVFFGIVFAPAFLSSGALLFLMILELGLIFSAPLWMEKSPLNILLFCLFPFLSGLTITPYLLSVLVGYANGASILLNALSATTCMSLAAAIIARSTGWNLAPMGKALVIGLIGLIVLQLFQFFVPALQTTQMELMFSSAGVLLFAAFTAYDMQRIARMGTMGANPFMLALSLYLDIFNLFIYLVRFMTILSGDRR